MVHEFTALAAWITPAGASVAGCCGLLMCRAMLRFQTASSLRREAAIEMMKRESFSSLSSHQQAAVFAALSASVTPHERSTRQGRSRGFQNLKTQRSPVPLRTFIN